MVAIEIRPGVDVLDAEKEWPSLDNNCNTC